MQGPLGLKFRRTVHGACCPQQQSRTKFSLEAGCCMRCSEAQLRQRTHASLRSRLHATRAVQRHRHVDVAGACQLQVAHHLNEFILRLREPWIEVLLLLDRGHVSSLVVVTWKDLCGSWQREEALMHAAVQLRCVALLEVCPPASADQQGVTREDQTSLANPRQVDGDASVRVSWCRDDLQIVGTNMQSVTVVHEHVCGTARRPRHHGLHIDSALADRSGRGDVVVVAVRVDDVLEVEPELVEHGQVVVLLLKYWINQDRLLRARATKQIGEG
mmetsp:Transcript_118047/g.306504  ORF Transcript_118047/g.306504 Transcript_118047/m.306504 type:complete len:273 (+) Transcript_118047:204-1022(+)